MTFKTTLCAVAALGVLAATGPVSAAVYTVTYKGVIQSGVDTDLFGGLGNVAGRPWAAVFTVDTTRPGATTVNDFLASGSTMIYGDGSVKAVFSIGDASINLGEIDGSHEERHNYGGSARDSFDSTALNQYYARNLLSDPNDENRWEEEIWDYYYLRIYLESSVTDIADDNLETLSPNYTVGPRDTVRAELIAFSARTEFLNDSRGPTIDVDHARAILKVASVTSAEVPASPVPEPATWVLMILGFGGAGAMARRRRRQMATH